MAKRHYVASLMATGEKDGRRAFAPQAWYLAEPAPAGRGVRMWELTDPPLAKTPPWAKGEEPGLLLGLVRVDSEVRLNGAARQSGGNLSPLRDPHISDRERADLLYGCELRKGHGRRGRRHRTSRRDREIRLLRRQIEQNGGDKWFDPNPPEPEWDPLDEWRLRRTLMGDPPSIEEERQKLFELGWRK